ncbi:MAG: hypothetical protein KF832_23375 [Caldilineaceae bacterium]|nr:hypothetical protein [Caldilineaceae bacterium]
MVPNGNLTSQRDARNLWIYMNYDDLNRLTSKRKDSTSGPKIAEYLYDTLQQGQLYASKAYDASGSSVVAETQTSALDTRYRPTERKW